MIAGRTAIAISKYSAHIASLSVDWLSRVCSQPLPKQAGACDKSDRGRQRHQMKDCPKTHRFALGKLAAIPGVARSLETHLLVPRSLDKPIKATVSARK